MGCTKDSWGCIHGEARQSGTGRKRAFLDCSTLPQGVWQVGDPWQDPILGSDSSKALAELFELSLGLKGIILICLKIFFLFEYPIRLYH